MTNKDKTPDQTTTSREQLDSDTLAFIERLAREVLASIERCELPAIDLPLRSLSNVCYDPDKGYFELGDAVKSRPLSVNTARLFAQTLKLMAVSHDMVQHDDFATKREACYISKNWGDSRFEEQRESDAVMEDIEALASLHGLSREQLHFHPEAHGGDVLVLNDNGIAIFVGSGDSRMAVQRNMKSSVRLRMGISLQY